MVGRMAQTLQQFVPDQELMELAGMIRDLKSAQISSLFTLEDGEHRCVMGALMVEKFGASDTNIDISNTLYSTRCSEVVDPKLKLVHRYWSRLADRNNDGQSFAQIADWVESQAYRYGEWK